MITDIESLNKKILLCKNCKRLVNFREKVAKEKRKQYIDETYWGKPITGFGDINAELLIIGLAPAAHGANRTGRVFTGDKSSDFLYKCLHKCKISNLKRSSSKNDSLKLKNTYITLALKCLPPKDKPTSEELKNCFKFFKKEIEILKNVKVILTLGKIAFDSCISFFNLEKKSYVFKHGNLYKIGDDLAIMASYHPSPRNVNSKRIDEEKMIKVIKNTKKFINHI
tara:strand:+ start:194 stop:868 length:675 start_codon:yes stop_codon:yes gene_type:complete